MGLGLPGGLAGGHGRLAGLATLLAPVCLGVHGREEAGIRRLHLDPGPGAEYLLFVHAVGARPTQGPIAAADPSGEVLDVAQRAAQADKVEDDGLGSGSEENEASVPMVFGLVSLRSVDPAVAIAAVDVH